MSNEKIWAGKFGTEYTKRNDGDYSPRRDFWEAFTKRYSFANVLEVGCNTGMNLRDIAWHVDHPANVWGVEINTEAVQLARDRNNCINFCQCSGLDLPFRDEYFDLVFTAGVLIHQTPDTFEVMMQEIMRVSNNYVMAIEYEADVFTEVPYRGLEGALYKGPWGDIYEKRYGLRLIESKKVGKDAGWDDCRLWLFTKR